MEKILKFKCPKCDSDVLEEIMIEVILSTPIRKIAVTNGEYEPDYDHSNAETLDGQIDRYQCAKCGFIVPVRNLEALTATEYMHEATDECNS
jgi:hypothetical protein